MALTKECSVAIQNKPPAKLKDPDGCSIPCLMRSVLIDHALCDLGSSVILVPFSLYKKLDLGEMRPTTISLELADRSIKYPVGTLEDVPMKVGAFYVLDDFIVLDIADA